MTSEILEQLIKLETEEDVRVLFACESGSRAWGFESTDSDWDVRFIYVRPRDAYLSIEPIRDVLEAMLPNNLDLAGWDLRKALHLMRKSNPSLMEWLRSPIVYRADAEFLNEVRDLADRFVSKERLFHHYFSMARGNFLGYLQGEQVAAKKYLYVLRPILACRWIAQRSEPPPVEFTRLVEATMPEGPAREKLDQLLIEKRAGVEMGLQPVIPELHAFIEAELTNLSGSMPKPKPSPSAAPLDECFRRWLDHA